jgi:hypothetical protein
MKGVGLGHQPKAVEEGEGDFVVEFSDQEDEGEVRMGQDEGDSSNSEGDLDDSGMEDNDQDGEGGTGGPN